MLTILLTAVVTLVVVLAIANLSTGEKKIEHKIERRYGSDDPQFIRSMGLLLGPPVTSGNCFDVLLNGDEIFPSMLEGIASAQKTITFETFIYWSGAIGEQFASALSEKARSGVAVHVLLDWVGSQKMDRRYLEMLKTAGAEVIQYHKPHWTGLGRMNDRTHRKLLVIDGRIGFTGGVGIAQEWTGHAQDDKHWRDSHFRVRGPVVGHMQAVFMDNWIKATGNVLHGPNYFPEADEVGDGLAHMFSSSPSGGSDDMQLMYLMAITAATRSIHLASAYFVPDKLTINAIIEAARRRADTHARQAHRYAYRARGVSRMLGTAARSRRADVRVPTDDVPRQAARGRRIPGVGRLDQFRFALVQAERRSQPQYLRRRVCTPSDADFRQRSREVQTHHARRLEQTPLDQETRRSRGRAARFPALTRKHGL
jgi:cardiolipin synthase